MKTKTTIIVKLSVDGMHNFPAAAELFPEVAFLADRHRHTFHFTVAKEVFHDDRDVEFIIFKRDILNYLSDQYSDNYRRTLEFGPKSCEMLAREILQRFECDWVEVWEDQENGARVEKLS
jgi:hypothetical protein